MVHLDDGSTRFLVCGCREGVLIRVTTDRNSVTCKLCQRWMEEHPVAMQMKQPLMEIAENVDMEAVKRAAKEYAEGEYPSLLGQPSLREQRRYDLAKELMVMQFADWVASARSEFDNAIAVNNAVTAADALLDALEGKE